MVAQITIPVSNVSDLLGLGFTRIEVWLTDEFTNQYYEVTASAAASAKLTSVAATTLFRAGGRQLGVSINDGAEQLISFSSLIDYWTPAQVRDRINEVVVGLASVVGETVVLTAPTTGRASKLQITYNGVTDLGFRVGDKAYGQDARIPLVGGTVIYQYSDVVGVPGNQYKWRFSANGVSPLSEFSAPVDGSTPPVAGVPVSIATASFVGMDGRAKKMKVIIACDRPPTMSGLFSVGNERYEVYEADDNGFLQITLVQGLVIRVAIEGTTYVREITVPNTSTFDLLAALSTAPDPFTVAVPTPFLTRRSI